MRKKAPRAKRSSAAGGELPAMEFIEEVATLAIEEFRSMRHSLRWLSGKTVHLHLLKETAAEVQLDGNTLKVRVGGAISGDPDVVLATTRRTVIDLLEGRETPSSALFQGRLRVAGRSEDLVRVHDVFLRVVERFARSKRLQRLYTAAKSLKVPSRPLEFEVSGLNGAKPRLSFGFGADTVSASDKAGATRRRSRAGKV